MSSIEKFIGINQSILSDTEITALTNLKNELSGAIETAGKDQLLSLIQKINDYALPLAHRAMDNAVVNALSGKKIN